MPIMSYAFYCVFESVMQLPNFDWEEDRQHAGQWGAHVMQFRILLNHMI